MPNNLLGFECYAVMKKQINKGVGGEGEGEVETVAQTVERVEAFVRWLGEVR